MTGIICVNKDRGITSFGVCSKLRGITGERKVGHTGTLDPMATGVLTVMLGGATRFLDYLPESDKSYKARFSLGMTTDTLDITGSVLSECEVSVTRDELEAVLEGFRGEISQLPPMYSAVSVDGKRLYELARQGAEIEREARLVEIKSLELTEFDGKAGMLEVTCSKGTYIRSLIDDIGRALGCGAVMTELERTRANGFSLDKCVTLDTLQQLRDSGEGFDSVLISLESIFELYPKVEISSAQAKRFSNGGALDLKRIRQSVKNGACRVYSPDGLFLGLGSADSEKGELSVLRLLTKRD